MNTYLPYIEKRRLKVYSARKQTHSELRWKKKSFDVGTLQVPFLKSRASKEVTSRWPVSSGQQSFILSLLVLTERNAVSGNEIGVFPETSMRNGFPTGGRKNYFFPLNFSKPSRTTYAQIFAAHRKH